MLINVPADQMAWYHDGEGPSWSRLGTGIVSYESTHSESGHRVEFTRGVDVRHPVVLVVSLLLPNSYLAQIFKAKQRSRARGFLVTAGKDKGDAEERA